MDFRLTPEQEQLKAEVRAFLEAELAAGGFQPTDNSWMVSYSRDFSRKLGARGWIGMTWPREYGGRGRSYIDRFVCTEELLRYGAPVAAHWVADRQMAPAIIAYGSEAQKREILPRIIAGEAVFCIGMSEPNSGSDLASLQTRATARGDEFIIDGQKVWTSGAHLADFIYLVARTDPQAPKHKGISELIVDMKLPGVSTRPLIDSSGDHHFNEVFFDGVRVPGTALVGQLNRGWYQIASQLDYERSGMERLMSNYLLYRDVFQYAKQTIRRGKPLADEPSVRYLLGDLAIHYEVGRLLLYRVAWVLSKGRIPNYEAALAKVFCTAFEQRLADAAPRIMGLHGQLLPGSSHAALEGRAAKGYSFAPGYTLQGGTSEILRNIVAIRGLGLPAS